LPHVLTICTFGVSPDQGHDTAFVQHYHEKKLYPWLESNCHKIRLYMMRCPPILFRLQLFLTLGAVLAQGFACNIYPLTLFFSSLESSNHS
jgi:hypothetical protein